MALIGEVDLVASGGVFVQALGFGSSPSEAGHHARAGLLDDFEAVREEYARDWRDWQETLTPPEPDEPGGRDLFRASTAVLRSHEDKGFAGAVVASLSTPWGQARSDEKIGPVGYHVVWPRDLVEVAGGLLAAGAKPDALRVLRYLRATQDGDGHWPQNQLVDGSKVWDSIQMGETALPVLLVNLLMREGVLAPDDLARFWPMVRAAVGYIARKGPSSQEDRWEDSRGFTPYTLSALISALLVAAEMADARGEPGVAAYLRESADTWNDNIEFWTYVEDTELARRVGVRGYYLRIAPPDDRGEPAKYDGDLRFWYNPEGRRDQPPRAIVSPDALAYVRFGLRAADDPRILDTVKVIDAINRVDLPQGPCWHRYNHDGYGEKADGSPFDDEQGIGRAWPLLTGERAHYELAAGRPAEAARLLHAMEAFANEGGMIPEQVWDSADIPSKGLFAGRPSGSSMPLAWAHAEYLKLRRSLADGRPFDTPPQVKQRYAVEGVRSRFVIWRPDHRRRAIPAGKSLRVEVHEPAVVRWGAAATDGDADPRHGAGGPRRRPAHFGAPGRGVDPFRPHAGRGRAAAAGEGRPGVGPDAREDRVTFRGAGRARCEGIMTMNTPRDAGSWRSPGLRPASAGRRPGRSPGGGRASACWPGASTGWKGPAGRSRRWAAAPWSCRPTWPTPTPSRPPRRPSSASSGRSTSGSTTRWPRSSRRSSR